MTEIETTVTERGVGVVTPKGRVTMTTAPRLREAVTDLVDAGTIRIVVDLGETTFLDSSGLGSLVAGLKHCRQGGGDLRIARPTAAVSTVLQMTNLDRILTPRDTVEEAY